MHNVGGKVVTVLRDTGCSTVFVRSNLVSDNQKTIRAKVITLNVNDDACVAVQTRSEAKKEDKGKQKLDVSSSTNEKVEGMRCSREKMI